MPKKTGIAIIAVGAALILSALLLLLYNRYEDAHAGQEAESLLASVEEAISAQTMDVPTAAANVEQLAGSGICGVAVISAIYAAKDIQKASADLRLATEKMLHV